MTAEVTSERIEVQRTIAADPTWKEGGIFPVLSEGALRATLGILGRTVARGYPGLPA